MTRINNADNKGESQIDSFIGSPAFWAILGTTVISLICILAMSIFTYRRKKTSSLIANEVALGPGCSFSTESRGSSNSFDVEAGDFSEDSESGRGSQDSSGSYRRDDGITDSGE